VLESVQSRLREQLALLERPAAAPEALATALDESQSAIEALSRRLATTPLAADRDRIQLGLEQALRLNAVALEMTETEARRLADELGRARDAHRTIRDRSPMGESGHSCNVAG
jgi:hypothetical protein